jgi:hypothetical protein
MKALSFGINRSTLPSCTVSVGKSIFGSSAFIVDLFLVSDYDKTILGGY